jgi:8-oxo-dGTP diphosphatase
MPYTICSIHREGSVLMLLGDGPPSAGLWSGIGGKVSPGEAPFGRVRRGVPKEAEIDLQTDRVRFAGIVR